MFTLFGFLGQTVYNRLDARHSQQVAMETDSVNEGRMKKQRGFWNKIADMRWSPLKTLTDEEYGDILREKLLRVDAEIALVSEQVEKLRAEGVATDKKANEPLVEGKGP